jgi:hypothetical protein
MVSVAPRNVRMEEICCVARCVILTPGGRSLALYSHLQVWTDDGDAAGGCARVLLRKYRRYELESVTAACLNKTGWILWGGITCNRLF